MTEQIAIEEQSELLLGSSKPEIYSLNAFRVSGLPVEATTKDILRQIKMIEAQERAKITGVVKAGPLYPVPAPSVQQIKDALFRLQDPEKRLIDEFFWFWPHLLGQSATDEALNYLKSGNIEAARVTWNQQEKELTGANVSTHNLVVLSHTLALDLEHKCLEQGLSSEEYGLLEGYWKATLNRWAVLIENEGFWSRLSGRVKEIDDPRLTIVTARNMRKSLPTAILTINAQLAVLYAERGQAKEVKRQLMLLEAWRDLVPKQTGTVKSYKDAALRRALEPTRNRLKTMCKAAEAETDETAEDGERIVKRLVDTAEPLVKIFELLLPEKDLINVSVHDEVAMTVLSCQISFGAKTNDWQTSVHLLQLGLPFAKGITAREKLTNNINVCTENGKSGGDWVHKGYFQLPKPCIAILEKGRKEMDNGRLDEAIAILRNGYLELEDAPHPPEFVQHLRYGLGFLFNRKSVRKLNNAIDDYNYAFDKMLIDSVNYAFNGALIGTQMVRCADCNGSIYGTYYTRTIQNRKFPFCTSCSSKMDNKIEQLDQTIKKARTESLEYCVLAHSLDPDDATITENLRIMKEGAKKYNITVPEAGLLRRRYSLTGIRDLVQELTSEKSPSAAQYSALQTLLNKLQGNKRAHWLLQLLEIASINKDNANKLWRVLKDNHLNEWITYFLFSAGNLRGEREKLFFEVLTEEENYTVLVSVLTSVAASAPNDVSLPDLARLLVRAATATYIKTDIRRILFTSGPIYNMLADITTLQGLLAKDILPGSSLYTATFISILNCCAGNQELADQTMLSVHTTVATRDLFYNLMSGKIPGMSSDARKSFLISYTKHWDVTSRKRATEWLSSNLSVEPASVKLFVGILSDPDESISTIALQWLIKHGASYLNLLFEALRSDEGRQREHLLHVFKALQTALGAGVRDTFDVTTVLRNILSMKRRQDAEVAVKAFHILVPDWTTHISGLEILGILKQIAENSKHVHNAVAEQLLEEIRSVSVMKRFQVWRAVKREFTITTSSDSWYVHTIFEPVEPMAEKPKQAAPKEHLPTQKTPAADNAKGGPLQKATGFSLFPEYRRSFYHKKYIDFLLHNLTDTTVTCEGISIQLPDLRKALEAGTVSGDLGGLSTTPDFLWAAGYHDLVKSWVTKAVGRYRLKLKWGWLYSYLIEQDTNKAKSEFITAITVDMGIGLIAFSKMLFKDDGLFLDYAGRYYKQNYYFYPLIELGRLFSTIGGDSKKATIVVREAMEGSSYASRWSILSGEAFVFDLGILSTDACFEKARATATNSSDALKYAIALAKNRGEFTEAATIARKYPPGGDDYYTMVEYFCFWQNVVLKEDELEVLLQRTEPALNIDYKCTEHLKLLHYLNKRERLRQQLRACTTRFVTNILAQTRIANSYHEFLGDDAEAASVLKRCESNAKVDALSWMFLADAWIDILNDSDNGLRCFKNARGAASGGLDAAFLADHHIKLFYNLTECRGIMNSAPPDTYFGTHQNMARLGLKYFQDTAFADTCLSHMRKLSSSSYERNWCADIEKEINRMKAPLPW